MQRGAILICATLAACGQSFEVASVRPHPGPAHSINITTSGPLLRAEAEFVNGLVLYAYNLKNYQLDWAPGLKFDESMYDIVAKAEGDGEPTKDEFRQMLQSLLADRFKLKVHREQREMPVYALVVGKNGPKFKESGPDAPLFGNHTVNGRNQTMALPKATMEQVASELPLYAGRPVLDKTGLTGTYAIRLEATPKFRMDRDPDAGDISVFTAVQDQLGLRLEAQKAMVEVLVIDHVEKPTDN
jgi:uncharacterized protein (TIGR03435 family)